MSLGSKHCHSSETWHSVKDLPRGRPLHTAGALAALLLAGNSRAFTEASLRRPELKQQHFLRGRRFLTLFSALPGREKTKTTGAESLCTGRAGLSLQPSAHPRVPEAQLFTRSLRHSNSKMKDKDLRPGFPHSKVTVQFCFTPGCFFNHACVFLLYIHTFLIIFSCH